MVDMANEITDKRIIETVKLKMGNFYPSPEKRNKIAKRGIVLSLLLKLINIFWFNRYTQSGMDNWMVSVDVYDRLILRHAILSRLEGLESNYEAFRQSVDLQNTNDNLAKYKINSTYFERSNELERNNNPYLRSYRLAATDLFVEKAIAYLEIDCNKYTKRGLVLFYIGIFIILIGMAISFISHFGCDIDYITINMLVKNSCTNIKADISKDSTIWIDFLSKFVKGFIFYGLIVLSAVGCWRLGKAMMDQAERLRERRHSLRQGRLFIHLNNGNVTIEQLEKAFDWNVSKGNAFANIETEASAPWGSVLKEIAKAIPEIFKKARDASGK